jgi:hypothetical protein
LADQIPMHDDQVSVLNAEATEEQERQTRLLVAHEKEKGQEFHVFLCHNSKDKPDVKLLKEKLQEQGIVAWMDEDGILAGQQFVPELERVLDYAPSAAVIIGPHWMGRWQFQEYYSLFQRYVEHRTQPDQKRLVLIPILLPGAPMGELELPTFLRGFTWIDFRRVGGLENREQMRRLIRAVLEESK